jgi:hypothetical protein
MSAAAIAGRPIVCYPAYYGPHFAAYLRQALVWHPAECRARQTMGQVRKRLLQDFDLLEGVKALSKPCEIPAWAGHASHKARCNRIGGEGKNDRNRCSGLFGRAGCWRPDCNEQIDSRSKQLSDEPGEIIELPLSIPPLDDEVPTLDVTERTKLILGPKRIDTRRHRRSAAENPDTVDCPGLLRLGGERRGEKAAGQGAEECPPIHHVPPTWPFV